MWYLVWVRVPPDNFLGKFHDAVDSHRVLLPPLPRLTGGRNIPLSAACHLLSRGGVSLLCGVSNLVKVGNCQHRQNFFISKLFKELKHPLLHVNTANPNWRGNSCEKFPVTSSFPAKIWSFFLLIVSFRYFWLLSFLHKGVSFVENR